MALRKIIYIEDELLRKKSRPVEKFDEKLHRLLDDMAETMVWDWPRRRWRCCAAWW